MTECAAKSEISMVFLGELLKCRDNVSLNLVQNQFKEDSVAR
jgi:hypothetical protein